jgi:hypothetical protein
LPPLALFFPEQLPNSDQLTKVLIQDVSSSLRGSSFSHLHDGSSGRLHQHHKELPQVLIKIKHFFVSAYFLKLTSVGPVVACLKCFISPQVE